MQDVSFLQAVQIRTARIAVSASATRNQGAGTVKAGRYFLSALPLVRFSVPEESTFKERLDEATIQLCSALKSSGSWGLARKLLNIFLRDALYTTYLEREFALKNIETFLEVPLDGIVAKQLSTDPRLRKPRWRGVKYVTSELNERYQGIAAEHAARKRIARVHLDTFLWGVRGN